METVICIANNCARKRKQTRTMISDQATYGNSSNFFDILCLAANFTAGNGSKLSKYERSFWVFPYLLPYRWNRISFYSRQLFFYSSFKKLDTMKTNQLSYLRVSTVHTSFRMSVVQLRMERYRAMLCLRIKYGRTFGKFA